MNFQLRFPEGIELFAGLDDAVDDLIQEATKILAKYDLKIKGWAKSGHPPPEKISVDGKEAIGGLLWDPLLDEFSSN